jgi:hypothetical protein
MPRGEFEKFGITPDAVVRRFFYNRYGRIYAKVALQVRRSPRRQTGVYKTNRENRWTLDPQHPDYTAKDQIPLIEAKLFAMALGFDGAPEDLPDDVRQAAAAILGKQVQAGSYNCPVSGVKMIFALLQQQAQQPVHGRSSFHVGHVRPRAVGGGNTADNTYWISDLGNRIQGDKSWHDTVRTIIEMAEYHRKREGDITWGELVNRYFQ